MTRTTIQTTVKDCGDEFRERLKVAAEKEIADAGVDPEQVSLRSIEVEENPGRDKVTIEVKPR